MRAVVSEKTGGPCIGTPSCHTALMVSPRATKAIAFRGWVCTTHPTFGCCRYVSLWIGYSECRLPEPPHTRPSQSSSRISSGLTSSSPSPDAFMSMRSPPGTVSYTHLRAHETKANLVCRLLLEKKKKKKKQKKKKKTKKKKKKNKKKKKKKKKK